MTKAIFHKYYPDLVQSLPMSDAKFRAKLYSADLLPDNLWDEIRSQATAAHKAEQFLDYAVKNDTDSFNKLLVIMKDYNDDHLKKLAEMICTETDIQRPLAKKKKNTTCSLKHLKHIMRREAGITVEWYDIGLELFDGNTVALDEIKAKYSSDVNACCTEMFKKWLQYNPEADWDQLASVLSEVGLTTAAENIKMDVIDDDDEVNYIEKELKARTLTKLKGKFAYVIFKLQSIFEQQKLDVRSLMVYLCAVDINNMTIFSTDEAFKKIHSIRDLFHHIAKYCSIYDYDLLEAFVAATECPEATKLLNDFTEELHSSILSDLDLWCDDGELRNPKVFMPGTHKLVIKYVGGKCTIEIEKLVRNIVCEHFNLKKASITFKGTQKDSDSLVYQISPAVKSHLQQYPITADDIFSRDKIKSLIINDEELKFPMKLQAKYTVVLTGFTGSGKSAACNFYMQNKIVQSHRSFEAVTSTASSGMAFIEGKHITLVDMPDFFLNPSSGEMLHYERFEVAKGLIKITSGFHMLGLVLNVANRISEHTNELFKSLLYKYNHYLPYTVLIFTHGKCLGETEDTQRTELEHMIKKVKESNMLYFSELLEKINHRYVIMESIQRMEEGYYASKSKELVEMIDTIFKKTGKPATNGIALSIAENLMKVKVDQAKLLEELAERIRIAQAMMQREKDKNTESNDFYAYLLSVTILGGGTLATLLPQDAKSVGHDVLSTTGTCIFQ